MNTGLRDKIIYWIATALLCGIMLFSASMYFTKYEMVKGFFVFLGFPTYIIYPLATAKILGVLAIISKKSNLIKEWAYAGFFFNTCFAAAAHINAHDGGQGMAFAAMVSLIISRIFDSRVFKQK
jgi:hypothetical protein